MLRWRSWESNPVPLAYGMVMLSERSTLERLLVERQREILENWQYEQMSYIPGRLLPKCVENFAYKLENVPSSAPTVVEPDLPNESSQYEITSKGLDLCHTHYLT